MAKLEARHFLFLNLSLAVPPQLSYLQSSTFIGQHRPPEDMWWCLAIIFSVRALLPGLLFQISQTRTIRVSRLLLDD